MLAGLIGLLALLASAVASAGVLHPGHSGHWFVPERSGEGWVLEILDEQRALVYWFTYDEVGDQRWLIGEGTIREDDEGWYLDFPDMYLTRGPAFGPEYDPSSLVIEVVGDGEMRFTDCDHGLFEFEGLGQELAFPVQRLTRTMGADCSAPLHGRPGEPLQPYAGHSGSWYEPASSGQGFALQWMTNDHAVVTWFTYDTEGNQQWMLGVGSREDDRVVFSDLHATRGGRFGEDFDPDSVERLHWGELELELDCDAGTAEYDSDLPGFPGGELNLERLSSISSLDCPWTSPGLDDLYEVQSTTVYEGPERLYAESISVNGIIAGAHDVGNEFRAFRMSLDSGDWETFPGEVGRAAMVRISSEGNVLIANDPVDPDPSAQVLPIFWKDGSSEWEPMTEVIFPLSVYLGVSKDFSHVVGVGRSESDRHPWIWTEQSGQVELPVTEETSNPDPIAVSNDGATIIGNAFMHASGGPTPGRELAIRWQSSSDPHFLYDSLGYQLGRAQACNTDCSIVFGVEQAEYNPDHPSFRQPWYWREPGDAGYLGRVPDTAFIDGITVAPAIPFSTTGDGTMVVGNYTAFEPNGALMARPFIWTMKTGMVALDTIISDSQGGGWDSQYVAISQDGRFIVLSEDRDQLSAGTADQIYRIRVLEFIPK